MCHCMQERFGDTVAVAGVLFCLCALPAIHGFAAWLVCRHRANKASGQATKGTADSSPLTSDGGQPLLNKKELAAQQRMGMDNLCAWASVPVLPMMTGSTLLAILYPAEGVLLWHRAVALATVGATFAGILGRAVVMHKYPVSGQKYRNLLWSTGQGVGSGLLQLGNVLVQAKPFWAPSTEINLCTLVFGLMEVTYPWFSAFR